MKNPFDQLSPDDMKAFGDALGETVGKHLEAAVQNAAASVLEKYESVTFTVTVKLNKKT